MQIDFKALEQALAPIEEIGQGELTFDAAGTTVTLRVLRPAEELAVQRYASEAMTSEDDPTSAVDYLDRFRVSCLAHAVVAVGDMDFRDLVHVETGEVLANGTPIKIPKAKALQTLIDRWSRSLLLRAFRKYHELTSQVEQKAEKAVVFTPSDLDAEIERLESHLAELKAEKANEATKATEAFTSGMTAALREEERIQQVGDVLKPATGEREAPPATSGPQVRRPISPVAATPPSTGHVTTSPSTPVQAPIQVPAQPAHPPTRPDSSFIDAGDDEATNAALAAEHQRLLAMRRRSAQGLPAESEGSGSALEQVHPQLQPGQRRPPHMDAAEIEAEVHAVAAARHLGDTAEGVPVFALPAQDLEVAPNRRPQPDKGTLNRPVNPAESRNPRFRQPSKP